MTPVTVIGAGLAGCECAWQLAGRGIPVRLIEMKPQKMSPAHVSENFAELVCSNSLRSDELTNAVGLLKEELRRLDSVVLASADHNRCRRRRARLPWTVRPSPARSRSASARTRISPLSARRRPPSPRVRSSLRPVRSRVMPWPRRSSACARSSTCIFMMPSRPSSRLRAWIWTVPFSPAAMIRARRTTSTAPWIRRSIPPRSGAAHRQGSAGARL